MSRTFRWDRRKASVNLAKHGVSFEEAQTVFDDPFANSFSDDEHSISEEREIIVGLSNRNRVLVVAFLQRAIELIRIISARLATRQERIAYEEDIYNQHD